MDPRVVPATLRLKVGAPSPVFQHLHNYLHLGKIRRIRAVVMSYNYTKSHKILLSHPYLTLFSQRIRNKITWHYQLEKVEVISVPTLVVLEVYS